jgi:hypothetical protein
VADQTTPAAELARHEAVVRALAAAYRSMRSMGHEAAGLDGVLAEYDRRGAELEQLLTTHDVRELMAELALLRAQVAELEAGETIYAVRWPDGTVNNDSRDRRGPEMLARNYHPEGAELVQAHRGPWEAVSS